MGYLIEGCGEDTVNGVIHKMIFNILFDIKEVAQLKQEDLIKGQLVYKISPFNTLQDIKDAVSKWIDKRFYCSMPWQINTLHGGYVIGHLTTAITLNVTNFYVMYDDVSYILMFYWKPTHDKMWLD